MRGVELSWIKVGGQKRRVQIALHRTDATRALVKAQGEWLFERRATAMTELAEFGRACGDFKQGAARACNGASQHVYEHPWCSQSHASPILFLPCLVGKFLDDDGVTYRHDLMHQAAMQAFAVSRQLALLSGLPAARFLVASTRFPVQLPLVAR
jgi:hypothetical protein